MNFKVKHLSKFIPAVMAILFSLTSFSLSAQWGESDENEELGVFEKLDEYLPEDLTFVTQDYDTVNLKDVIDKPTVLVLVYYECPGICSPLLEGVAEVISRSEMQPGEDYQIFTISFNPAESARLAKDKKNNYAKLVNNKDVDKGWTYFVGDSISIDRLLNSVGFKVKKVGKDWLHPTALIVLSPEAKITRYLHGLTFLPFDLKMAVAEAQIGRSGPTINKVLRYCFSYEPEGKKYVLNITKITGTFILLFAVILLLVLIFRKKDKKLTKEI